MSDLPSNHPSLDPESTSRLHTLQESARKDLAKMLSGSPLAHEDVFSHLTSDATNVLIEIGRMGDLDAGYDKHSGQYTITISGLEDCTDGFIWSVFPIIGRSKNLSDALLDLGKKINSSGDFVVRDKKTKQGYRNILLDDATEQYYQGPYTVYSDVYAGHLQHEAAFNAIKGTGLVVQKSPEGYVARSHTFLDTAGKRLAITGPTPLDAANDFIAHLQTSRDRYFQNGKIQKHFLRNPSTETFDLTQTTIL